MEIYIVTSTFNSDLSDLVTAYVGTNYSKAVKTAEQVREKSPNGVVFLETWENGALKRSITYHDATGRLLKKVIYKIPRDLVREKLEINDLTAQDIFINLISFDKQTGYIVDDVQPLDLEYTTSRLVTDIEEIYNYFKIYRPDIYIELIDLDYLIEEDIEIDEYVCENDVTFITLADEEVFE